MPFPSDGGCIEACISALTGVEITDLPDLWAPELEPYEWQLLWARWARDRGLTLRRWARIPRGFAIVIGCSPRSPETGRHAVLARDGRLVFDPHASCAGVLPPFVAYWYEEAS